MGIGVSSLFAFGSAGTLVLGLASQNLAQMFVNGLTLSTSDRIREGDHIRFGDGTNGKVEKIGWMQTTIKGYDELVEIIPNSQLGMQRVKNLSRIKKCRVRQYLRFKYEDAEKLVEKVLPDILGEIKQACPTLISDGSAVFRAIWQDFKEDHLRVMVEAHFKLPPMGQEYQENLQMMNLAIWRAVKRNGVDFVTTFYPSQST